MACLRDLFAETGVTPPLLPLMAEVVREVVVDPGVVGAGAAFARAVLADPLEEVDGEVVAATSTPAPARDVEEVPGAVADAVFTGMVHRRTMYTVLANCTVQ